MQPTNYHQKLLEQIQQTIGEASGVPESLRPLLQKISESYSQFDQAYKQLEAESTLKTQQLIASTSRAYSFLDSLNMGLILCDVNPEVVLSNTPIRKMLAAKLSSTDEPHPAHSHDIEWDLAKIDKMFQPELELKKLILQSLADNKPLECDSVNFGKYVLKLFIAPMVNEVSQGKKEQIGAVILVEDITEQKVLDRSKDEFLSIAAHELRTPLTAIRGNSSLIKKYYAEAITNPEMAEMIDEIHEASVRLIGIVNDFLDVSALEQGKIIMNPETIGLGEIIDDVTRELQNLCESKGISLVCDQSVADAPTVKADKQRTKQIIINLVGNAVKFTESGSITISTKADDNFVYTYVTDTGRGMADESQRLLFRKFQQAGSSLLTRDTTKGTGLGLYISKLIAELSGGKISLDRSEIGKGSTFVFSLPRDLLVK